MPEFCCWAIHRRCLKQLELTNSLISHRLLTDRYAGRLIIRGVYFPTFFFERRLVCLFVCWSHSHGKRGILGANEAVSCMCLGWLTLLFLGLKWGGKFLILFVASYLYMQLSARCRLNIAGFAGMASVYCKIYGGELWIREVDWSWV